MPYWAVITPLDDKLVILSTQIKPLIVTAKDLLESLSLPLSYIVDNSGWKIQIYLHNVTQSATVVLLVRSLEGLVLFERRKVGTGT